MTAADQLKALLQPLLGGWSVQYGAWRDDDAKRTRCAVIRPAGGGTAELIREPQFTLTFVGAKNDSAQIVADAVETVIEALRPMPGTATLFLPAEPVFVPTEDGRPMFDVAVSAIAD